MVEMRRCKLYIAIVGTVALFGFIYFGIYCPSSLCALTPGNTTPPVKSTEWGHNLYLESQRKLKQKIAIQSHTRQVALATQSHMQTQTNEVQFEDSHLHRNYDFHPDGDSVIVFLHIQKTGGTTFGKHLVKNLDVDTPCECTRGRKKCNCYNSQDYIWLFSRYSVGWPCGLHADWTELKDCVHNYLNKKEKSDRDRRYLYITILRDPVKRYLSEWKHVKRGATWKAAKLKCDGHQATLTEVPFCFEGDTWEGVHLNEFIKCPYNLANNRQARMLADLSLAKCYDTSAMSKTERDKVILESAKQNLLDMAFFGLTEYQRYTQMMFEDTFKIKFINDFIQYNETHASDVTEKLSSEDIEEIQKINHLDIELYKYAKTLFFERLHAKFGSDLGKIETIDRIGEASSDADEDENVDEEYVNEVMNNEDHGLFKREVNIRFDPEKHINKRRTKRS
ncbi:unnamed protein product [Owenia fusiformis]|uniref:Heparan-sulfate 6-O-sulfotransferase n=1 Tax=Owenia fusiformis TaxID=6347 RepID=A0A8J1UGU0_OWEFU|nr:unnamed protein product [Owenia fusiformis]